MFTGIILGLASLAKRELQGRDAHLTITPHFALDAIVDGESIAVNGVCLSVEKHSQHTFTCYASHETLSKTTLAHLPIGCTVNLERALAMGERLGGHIVTGHVDCVATVTDIRDDGRSRICRFRFPKEFAPSVLEKGSVALDGISLTVNACGPDFLEVNIIPDTQRRTNAELWKRSDKVNLESDVLGKYVQHILCLSKNSPETGVSRSLLERVGFL